MIGPFRGGRTRAVTGVPSQPHVFYVGAVDGGVWKTDDAGRSWHPLFDAQPTQSIGAIAVAPSDANIIYVGSGEGLHRPDLSIGDGIYRSGDGGKSWEHLGLRDSQQIPELAIDPRDPNRLFAAVLGHPYGASSERGIYRSLDGGKSWQQVLFKDNDTGGSAVALDPRHPDIVYAALWQDRLGPWEDRNEYQSTAGGLFKSTDGGNSWRPLRNGLPSGLAQINISVAASQPERIFAIVATTEPGSYSSAAGLGLFRSDDAGESWTRITTDPRPALRIGGGDLPVLRVDPTNPDVIYSASVVTMKSVDGGRQWQPLRGAPGGDDYQNLWVSPNQPDTIALVSDQGAVITLNGGRTWSSWFNQPTAQLYHVIATQSFPYRVCGAQQESGSVCILSRGNDGEITQRDWHPVGVIEYGYVAPDPLDADVVYGAGRFQVSKFHWSTGQVQNVTPVALKGADDRADRTEPLLFSPADPHTLYYAANKVYRTRDGGSSWQAISPDLTREQPGIPASTGNLHLQGVEHQRGAVYALSVSPVDDRILWAGTDDGLVWLTTDAGGQWENVTPPEISAWSKITQIEASHFDAATAYLSVNRMRIDDLRPYLFCTHDGGKHWQAINSGLPENGPVNTVREDIKQQGLLFAGTETSVWSSADAGGHWQSLQLNLPHTSMRDLAVHEDDLLLATHGRALWVLDDISWLRELSQPGRASPLLHPAPAYRLARSSWTDTPIPPDEPLAANPPSGAIIDYVLPRDAQHVSLELRDAHGELVRRYSSDDPPGMNEAELARELIPRYWLEPQHSLPRSAGLHRWVWNLRYLAPLSAVHGFPISAVPHATPREPVGPLVVPGEYRVQLNVDSHHYEQLLTVRADPRIVLPAGALDEQLRLARVLSELLSSTSRALLAAQSEQQQLQAGSNAGTPSEVVRDYAQQLSALLDAAAAEKADSAATPVITLAKLITQLDSLYKEVIQADAPPTAAQQQAAQTSAARAGELMQRWHQLQQELPRLNQALHAAHQPPVRADLAPAGDPNVADEE